MRRGGCFHGPTAALVETLEARRLLSGIVVTDAGGGMNYGADVTISQLDPNQTPVTLQDAVDAANNTGGNNTITFDGTAFPSNTQTTITLTGGPLELKGNVTIAGPGAGQVAVSGGNATTVFKVDAGAIAEIDGLTITDGLASIGVGISGVAGGGVYNAGTLALQNDVITGNSSPANAAGSGAGIYNTGALTLQSDAITFNSCTNRDGAGFFNEQGTVTVTDCTIAHNVVNTSGLGGGFFSHGNLTVIDSTISDNSSDGDGGGGEISVSAAIINSTISDNSAHNDGGGLSVLHDNVTITNSTIADNSSSFGTGGVFNQGNVTLSSTIVAGNTGGDWGQIAAATSSINNLVGDGTNTGLTNGIKGNIVGDSMNPVDPLLGPLADNGGPTQTMALLPGSPAIDAAGTTVPNNPLTGQPLTTDQRGTGFSRFVGSAIDIGAFEFAPVIVSAPTVIFGQDGLVTVSVSEPDGIGDLSLSVSSGGTFTHTLTAADNGSFTFDVGLLNTGTYGLHAEFTPTGASTSIMGDSSLTVLSFSQATQNLLDQVNTDGLAPGVVQSLDSKLQAVLTSLGLGNTTTAANQLLAFENFVRAQRGKKIDAALADSLLSSAQSIIDALQAT
jgi:hypothetical protein